MYACMYENSLHNTTSSIHNMYYSKLHESFRLISTLLHIHSNEESSNTEYMP